MLQVTENGAGDFSSGAGARPQSLPGVNPKGSGQRQRENAERGADGQPRCGAGELGRHAGHDRGGRGVDDRNGGHAARLGRKTVGVVIGFVEPCLRQAPG